MNLLIRDGSMLDTLRDDEQLIRTHLDHAVPQLDPQCAPQNKKEVVRIGMRVPVERPLALHDHHVEAIEPRHNLWRPKIGESRKFSGE
jgi:hypothetical protein